MNPGSAPKADAWSIESGYLDSKNEWKATPEELKAKLRAAMGAGEGRDLPPPSVAVIATDKPLRPTLCPQPTGRAWGWAVQLYAIRSQASWGIGDLADLHRLGEWTASLGAGFIQVNPLMAAQPRPPLEASPYYPSSRRFFSLLYLRIEDIPGAGNVPELALLTAYGRSLNLAESIDRDAIFRLKREALDLLWSRASAGTTDGPVPGSFADPECERFVRDSGSGLRQFALYCVLAEVHGPDWKAWSMEFRHPDSPAISLFAENNGARIAFHQWVQWLLDLQLERASKAIPLVQDLPIGFDPGGADAWAWQDMLALKASVGARLRTGSIRKVRIGASPHSSRIGCARPGMAPCAIL